jgi:hypothetical protein
LIIQPSVSFVLSRFNVEAEKKDFGKANCLFLLISMKETQDKLVKKYNKKK